MSEKLWSAELTEDAQVPHRAALHSDIRDAVQVDNTGKLGSVSVSSCQPFDQALEYVSIRSVGIIKAGRINEDYIASRELPRVGYDCLGL